MSEVLRLQTNVPETIALAFTEGLPIASKFGGDQIMFTLVDGRKMFLAPHVARQIEGSGVAAGEEFKIVKRDVAKGNKRIVEFAIELGAGSSKPPAPPAVGTASTPSVSPKAAVKAAAPVIASELRSPSSGASRYQPSGSEPPPIVWADESAAPEPKAALPSALRALDLSTVEFMKLAGRGAVDAILDTEAYARSKGLTDFVFDGDAVQKIMVSLYIDLRKGGRA